MSKLFINYNTNNLLELEDLHNRKSLSIDHLMKSSIADIFSEIIKQLPAMPLPNARQILWHAQQKHVNIPICTCGKNLSWHPDKRQYREYCSVKCSTKGSIPKSKQTNLVKYGVPHFSQTKEWRDSVKETSLERFGVVHYSQTKDKKDRTRATCQEKYGCDAPSQNQEVKERQAATMIEKYGAKTPRESPILSAKIEATMIERYGVSNPGYSSKFRDKIKATNLEKYGHTCAAANKKIRAQIIETRKRNYYTPATYKALHDPTWLKAEYESGKYMKEIADNLGIPVGRLHTYFSRYAIKYTKRKQSQIENKLSEYFKNIGLDLLTRDTTIIKPKELDIVFTKDNIAIEVNGTYYHSSEFNKNRNYHKDKAENAKQAGYQLLQFWDWELNDSWDKAIDIINSKLGLNKKIGARTLTIKILTSKEKKLFFNTNHMQNDHMSSINIGLVDKANNIYCAMSFGKSRYNKNYTWELIRLASAIGYSVIGGASKILKYFTNNYLGKDSLISYCDMRFSNGNVYEKLGFTLKQINNPGYCYVKSGKYAGSRNMWQKHLLKDKLKIFNAELTERENMAVNKYFQLWDCGQAVYIYENKG